MEHGPNLIALAVPFFFLFIGIELLIARRKKVRVYRLADALADLGCGVGQRVALVFFGYLVVAVYVWAYDAHRFMDVGGWKAWVFSIVAVDFIYYWWHRASHRINFMWAVHAVHHQSEDYNLAVALRQAILSPITSLPFNLPLMFMGVPPLIFGAVASINTLYQFWIHTELVGKLPGPIEAVMNTPAHHRVHHAINAQYLDKNYAGMFIVWDKLFGTFVGETTPCAYGTVKRLFSFDPFYAQFAEFGVVASKARGGSALDKLRVWFMPPEWVPGGPQPIPPPPEHKFEPAAAPAIQRYAAFQFAGLTVIAFLLMLYDWMDNDVLALPGVVVGIGLVSIGALLDGRRWAPASELLRLAATGAALAMWTWPRFGLALGVVPVMAVLASALWFRAASKVPAATALAA